MEFAVNYSPLLAGLVRSGQVRLDRFKCPAWPDLLDEARQTLPVYVHFPLSVGANIGSPLDDEQNAPADLERFARLMEATGTPLVNTHLILDGRRYPHIPRDSREPRHRREVVDALLRDLVPLILRFGAERVMVENVINEYGWLELSVLPEVIGEILEKTGCGLLLDLSHARLAARNLGLDERAYTAMLPVERIREVHITGIQRMEGELLERLLAAGDPGGYGKMLAGKWMDHLAMADADWPALEWLAGQLRGGRWGSPWVISLEYGGVGGFFGLFSERAVYLEQVPRIREILKG